MAKKKQLTPPAEHRSPSARRLPVLLGLVVVVAAVLAVLFLRSPQPSPSVTTSSGERSMKPAHIFHKQGEVRFISSTKEFITAVDVEIAETFDKRQLGLMFRETLAENQGMLFLFDIEDVQSFWMKNTLLSLDILYINAENKIVTIHKNTVPQSETGYESEQPALYVVEVKAGFTDRHGIRVGDTMQWNKL